MDNDECVPVVNTTQDMGKCPWSGSRPFVDLIPGLNKASVSQASAEVTFKPHNRVSLGTINVPKEGYLL